MRVSGVSGALARALVGILFGAIGFSGAASVLAQPLRVESELTPSEMLKIAVAPESPLVTPEQSAVTISLTLTNLTDAALSLNSTGFFLDAERMTSESALQERLALPELPGNIGAAQASLPASSLNGDESVTLSTEIPVSALQLPASGGAGVYVLYARVSLADGGSVVAATPLVWQGVGSDRLAQLHTVVPLVLPDTVDGMPTLDTLAALTGPGGTLTERVAAAIDIGATLAIDPRIPTAVAAFGSSAPASAVALLEQISSSGLTTFALQYADADLAAQAELGLPAPLEPAGFRFVTGNPVLSQEFNYSLPSVAWPAADSLSAQGVRFMRDAGFTSLLLSGNNLSPASTTSGTIDGLRVISLSPAVNDAAARAVEAGTAVEQTQARATVAALLALTAQSGAPSPPLTLGLSRTANDDGASIALIEQVSALPWVQSVNLDAVIARNDAMSVISLSSGMTRLDDLREALEQEPAIDEYGAVLVEPEFLAELQRLRILEFFRASLRETSPAYSEVSDAFFDRDARTLQSVRITTTSTTHVVGTETRIPIQVSNELPFEAGISARVSSANSSLLVREERTPFVTIAQDSSVNVTVPVQARVSAGQTTLLVTLLAQDGSVVDEAFLPVTIRSSWETIGLVVIGALISLFFGFGIWRSVRSRRTALASQQRDTEPN